MRALSIALSWASLVACGASAHREALIDHSPEPFCGGVSPGAEPSCTFEPPLDDAGTEGFGVLEEASEAFALSTDDIAATSMSGLDFVESSLDRGKTATAWYALERLRSDRARLASKADAQRADALRRAMLPRLSLVQIDLPVTASLLIDRKHALSGPVRGALRASPGRHRLEIDSGPCLGAASDMLLHEGQSIRFVLRARRR